MKQEIPDVRDSLPKIDGACTVCGHRQLTLRGTVRTRIERSLEGGAVSVTEVVQKESRVTWNGVSCNKCGAYCEVNDGRILELKSMIEDLRFRLLVATGRLMPANQLPC